MNYFYVYITASKRNGTLYIGKANDLARRIDEHKKHLVPGFTHKYNVTLLVYYEVLESYEAVLAREKQLKAWKREWKIALVEKSNPEWKDLFGQIAE